MNDLKHTTPETETLQQELPAAAEKKTPPAAADKDSTAELIKAIVLAALIALSIRSFIFEPFNIPSGSMFPTLLVGDYLFVEKYSYGYSKYSMPGGIINFRGRIFESRPERGDVVVFRQPHDPSIDYIKRLVGLPGDKIQVKGGILNINGKPIMRDFRNTEKVDHDENSFLYNKYIETLPNGLQHYIYEKSDYDRLDNTEVYTVPQGYYFAMGDNRDSSMDSRVTDMVGPVPAENLVGRAWFIFFSSRGITDQCPAGEGTLGILKSFACKIIKYPQAIRYERFFKVINKI